MRDERSLGQISLLLVLGITTSIRINLKYAHMAYMLAGDHSKNNVRIAHLGM